MSKGVRPALDRVEWKQALSWEAGVADYVVGPAEAIGYGNDEPDDMLRVAALCLQVAGPDGKPLFTREHLRLFKAMWLNFDGMMTVDGSPKYADDVFGRDYDRIARELYDGLSALLPPEEPE